MLPKGRSLSGLSGPSLMRDLMMGLSSSQHKAGPTLSHVAKWSETKWLLSVLSPASEATKLVGHGLLQVWLLVLPLKFTNNKICHMMVDHNLYQGC